MAFSLGMENQDKKTQMLMIGVLVVVIGGSLFMVLRQLVGGGSKGGAAGEPKFHCMECQAEFKFDPTKIKPEERMDPMMMMGMEMAIDCPECDAQRSAVAMTQCPSCKEYFVSEFSKMQYEAMRTGQQPDFRMMSDIVCPHCGINFREWAKEQRDKRKKK